jgi:hypothetical protein
MLSSPLVQLKYPGDPCFFRPSTGCGDNYLPLAHLYFRRITSDSAFCVFIVTRRATDYKRQLRDATKNGGPNSEKNGNTPKNAIKSSRILF